MFGRSNVKRRGMDSLVSRVRQLLTWTAFIFGFSSPSEAADLRLLLHSKIPIRIFSQQNRFDKEFIIFDTDHKFVIVGSDWIGYIYFIPFAPRERDRLITHKGHLRWNSSKGGVTLASSRSVRRDHEVAFLTEVEYDRNLLPDLERIQVKNDYLSEDISTDLELLNRFNEFIEQRMSLACRAVFR